MTNLTHQHTHGSHEAWDHVYEKLDLSYSEIPNSQGKLFELVKIDFLKTIFPKRGTMLEVGCGTAFVSLYFTKRGYRTVCLDINNSILKEAEKNFKKEKMNGEFVSGDAEELPFRKGQFDIVTSFGLLEHFEDPTKAIAEMTRVLKPGGLFFADIVPNRFSCQTLGNFLNAIFVLAYWSLKGKLSLGLKKAKRNFRPEYFENSISWQDYKKIMEKLNLKSVQIRGNRPFPRLTLPKSLDKIYEFILRPMLPLWKVFDRWNSPVSKFWGAGLWFWGYK